MGAATRAISLNVTANLINVCFTIPPPFGVNADSAESFFHFAFSPSSYITGGDGLPPRGPGWGCQDESAVACGGQCRGSGPALGRTVCEFGSSTSRNLLHARESNRRPHIMPVIGGLCGRGGLIAV